MQFKVMTLSNSNKQKLSIAENKSRKLKNRTNKIKYARPIEIRRFPDLEEPLPLHQLEARRRDI